MSHVATHCGSVGVPDDPPTIPIVIHNSARLNLAIALKRWQNESDHSWSKRQKRLYRLIEKIYKVAQRSSDDEITHHAPSYVHPEPQ